MLNKNISEIKGIGPKKAEILKRDASINTIEDMLYYTPRKYLDRSTCKLIKDCLANEIVTISGTIIDINISGGKKKFLELIIDDGSESLSGIFFGGINFFKKLFKAGDFILLSGKIDVYRTKQTKQIVHPDFDFIDINSNIQSINTGRIIPLYKSTQSLKIAGFDSRGFRKTIRIAIDEYLDYVIESFDQSILKKYNLINIKDAIFNIHFPDTFEDAENARKRLAFNELFFLQYYLNLSKKFIRENHERKNINFKNELLKTFISSIPFKLTAHQEKSIDEIEKDIVSPFPMNRLLQGDVGSGKTVVAMAASLISIGCGYQVAYMVPTEILAAQHYVNFKNNIPSGCNIKLLTGSLKAGEKNKIYESLTANKIDILIGTHALIQERVKFNNLGLIIIDEQHRFGVDQRASLRIKGNNSDILVMTATPIPRSLSLTLYGDLDISLIKTKPSNRLPVQTFSFPENKIRAVYNSINKYLNQGRQIYYVLPLIEESEKIDLKSAINVFDHLKNTIFPDKKIELIHGRLKQNEKENIMARFNDNNIDILVSTTVIEVGIDIPNANVIIIEHAERFGLSQLHQLRGRVGRGKHQSFCVLIHPEIINKESKNRINTIVNINDGFRIAEEDLKQRGAGQLIGTRQHGQAGDFEFTDFANDLEIISNAREEAIHAVRKIKNLNSALNEIKENMHAGIIKGIRKKRILEILS